MYTVDGTKITLTRGDTFKAHITIFNPDGSEYEPSEGDVIRFAMKKNYSDAEPLLVINIPNDSLDLIIDADATKPFDFGDYVYDIELRTGAGEVDTFITKAKLKLAEEVH